MISARRQATLVTASASPRSGIAFASHASRPPPTVHPYDGPRARPRVPPPARGSGHRPRVLPGGRCHDPLRPGDPGRRRRHHPRLGAGLRRRRPGHRHRHPGDQEAQDAGPVRRPGGVEGDGETLPPAPRSPWSPTRPRTPATATGACWPTSTRRGAGGDGQRQLRAGRRRLRPGLRLRAQALRVRARVLPGAGPGQEGEARHLGAALQREHVHSPSRPSGTDRRHVTVRNPGRGHGVALHRRRQGPGCRRTCQATQGITFASLLRRGVAIGRGRPAGGPGWGRAEGSADVPIAGRLGAGARSGHRSTGAPRGECALRADGDGSLAGLSAGADRRARIGSREPEAPDGEHPHRAVFRLPLRRGDRRPVRNRLPQRRAAPLGHRRGRVPRGQRARRGAQARRRHRYGRLVLRRGFTGRRDLYDWWSAGRDGAPARRNVGVLLLDEQRNVVFTWNLLRRSRWATRSRCSTPRAATRSSRPWRWRWSASRRCSARRLVCMF